MMPLIFWGLSIIVCFFIIRKAVSIKDDVFENDVGFLIVIIVLSLIPYVNILFALAFLILVIIDENDYDVNDIVKIIFFIKKEKK